MHHPTPSERFTPEIPAVKAPLFALSAEDRQAALELAREVREQRTQEWEALERDPATRLHQNFRNEAYMRAHLSAAGVRIASNLEPATPQRVLLLLRRAGVPADRVVESVAPFWTDTEGKPLGALKVLARFLEENPRLPLWAAVAFILELDGRFTAAVLMNFGR